MLILFSFPLIGLILDVLLTTRKLLYVLGCACLLLIPGAIGYRYTFSWGYGFFLLVGLSCAYSLFSKKIEGNKGKIWSAVLASGFLFLALGLFSIIDSFSGSQTVEQEWQTRDYKVEYVRDQGFAGGPLMKYELSKYSQIPFFIKKIETTAHNDTTQRCKVVLTTVKLSLTDAVVPLKKLNEDGRNDS